MQGFYKLRKYPFKKPQCTFGTLPRTSYRHRYIQKAGLWALLLSPFSGYTRSNKTNPHLSAIQNNNNNDEKRLQSIEKVALEVQKGNNKAVEALVYVLSNDANSWIRKVAVDGLSNAIEQPSVQEAFKQAIMSDGAVHVRITIAEKLGDWVKRRKMGEDKKDKVATILIQALKKEKNRKDIGENGWLVLVSIANAMGKTHNKECVLPLLDMLHWGIKKHTKEDDYAEKVAIYAIKSIVAIGEMENLNEFMYAFQQTNSAPIKWTCLKAYTMLSPLIDQAHFLKETRKLIFREEEQGKWCGMIAAQAKL